MGILKLSAGEYTSVLQVGYLFTSRIV